MLSIMLDNLSTQHGQALTLLAAFSAVPILYGLFRGTDKNRDGLPYPPGPKGRFLLGNLLDIPPFKPWLSYVKMGEKYDSKHGAFLCVKMINKTLPGDILYLTVLGRHIVVLNSVESAVTLLEKRANKYSDRPVIPTTEVLVRGFHSHRLVVMN